MPGGLPLGFEWSAGLDYGTVIASSIGTAIVPNATVNTKGSFTQLIAATSYDIDALSVNLIYRDSGTTGPFVFDIAVGASGAEQVIVNNLYIAYSGSSSQSVNYTFPISIKKGSRISMRSASGSASDAGQYVNIIGFASAPHGMEGPAGYDSIGIASGLPTSVASALNTKAAYAQLAAAVPRDYMGFFVVVDYNVVAGSDSYNLIDIAVGAAGAEQVIVPNIHFWGFNTTKFGLVPITFGPFFESIPKGSRVAARSACNSSASTAFYVGLIAAYQ